MASSGLPVTFSIISGPASIEGNIITLSGKSGLVIVSASQSGNQNYYPATVYNRSFIVTAVSKLNQLISFPSISDKLTTNNPFTLDATASSSLPVEFRILSGPATIKENIVTLTEIAGTVVVRASQNGNAEYLPAPDVDRPFDVTKPMIDPPSENEKQSQTINFPTIPDQLNTSEPITLTASASSNLPITYSILAGPAKVNGNNLTLNGTTGTIVVNAAQWGNEKYYPAQSINRAFKVIDSTENGEEDTSDPPTYCHSKGSAPWQQWIGNVFFGTMDNESFKENYGDFTNLVTSVNKEDSYEISIHPAFSWTHWDEYINVWIDYNQNGSFDDIGEHVLSGISLADSPQSIPQAVAGIVTIPYNAKTGKTRMRVNMQQAKYANACDFFKYGEVEDYTINILSAASNRTAQILNFSAYAKPNQVVNLEWISNGDKFANNYEVERSKDNLKFYRIQNIQPEGENDLPNFYHSADKAPLNGISFYRVKQINNNGSFKYSNAVEIKRAFGIEIFYLYPNPVKDVINIHLKPFIGQSATINIYNAYGQLVKESDLTDIQSPIISFSMQDKQNGIYYLIIKPKGRKTIGKKFILTRDY